jgi:hypothetical protein
MPNKDQYSTKGYKIFTAASSPGVSLERVPGLLLAGEVAGESLSVFNAFEVNSNNSGPRAAQSSGDKPMAWNTAAIAFCYIYTKTGVDNN